MAEASALEKSLGHSRTIVLIALAILCGLAWAYILDGAGLGMSAWSMTRFAFFPHRHVGGVQAMAGMAMPPSAPKWNLAGWALIIAMWWTMMIAMMTPSAAPAIMLYARVHRRAVADDRAGVGVASACVFAAGYLLLWLAFSIAAAVVHWLLVRGGDVSAAMMGSQSRWLSAGILILAGIYQQSPLKNACLSQCRSPASFLSRHWRPGRRGALRMGLIHGAYCIGCCWALMALLFVGGVMNLVWIAALTLIVLVEKLLPGGGRAGRVAGVVLIGWGLATLWV